MSYETEEQQVEALKAWWADNGRAVIAGVVLGGAAIGGWGLWQRHAASEALVASDLYSRATVALESGDVAEVRRLADELVGDHAGSLYTAYAQLAAARAALEAGERDDAVERLSWVSEEADRDSVRVVAALRLARIEAAAGDTDAALAALPDDYPNAFTGLIEEVRGDVFVQRGDRAAARDAYLAARTAGNVPDPGALSIKIDDLAVAEDAG